MSAKSLKPNTIRMITIHCLITLCLICLKLTNSNPVPDEIIRFSRYSQQENNMNSLDEQEQRALLKQIIRYSQNENLLKAENTDYSTYTNLEQFRALNLDQIKLLLLKR